MDRVLVDRIEEMISRHPGRCPVRIIVKMGAFSWKIDLSSRWKVQPGSTLYDEAERVLDLPCAIHLPGSGPKTA
jgi:hypothetical protein